MCFDGGFIVAAKAGKMTKRSADELDRKGDNKWAKMQREEFPQIASVDGILQENESVYLVDQTGEATEVKARVFAGAAQGNPSQFRVQQTAHQTGAQVPWQQVQQMQRGPGPVMASFREEGNMQDIIFHLDGLTRNLTKYVERYNRLMEDARKFEFLASHSDLKMMLFLIRYHSFVYRWHCDFLSKMWGMRAALLEQFQKSFAPMKKLHEALVSFHQRKS